MLRGQGHYNKRHNLNQFDVFFDRLTFLLLQNIFISTHIFCLKFQVFIVIKYI